MIRHNDPIITFSAMLNSMTPLFMPLEIATRSLEMPSDGAECYIGCLAVFWKRLILGPLPPLPIPRFRFRFHQNVVILLVAIPPTYFEAADKNNHFRFSFQNPGA